MTKRKGWNGESYRHGMAAKGINTRDNNNMFIQHQKLQVEKQKRNIKERDIKDIINGLSIGVDYPIFIKTGYATIYSYFDIHPDYEVSSIKTKIRSVEVFLPIPKIEHKFIIQSKENGNTVLVTDFRYYHQQVYY